MTHLPRRLPGLSAPVLRWLAVLVVTGLLAPWLAGPGPVAAVAPGPVVDLTGAVTGDVAHARAAGDGSLAFATVAVDDAPPLWQAAWWLITRADVALVGPLDTEDTAAAAEQMRQAKATALTVAARAAGRPAARLDADTGQVLGPSAGLMLALAYLDALTPGDLTAGRVVVGTGTLELDGTVGPVGGAGLKATGAAAAGADVFLVPVPDRRDAVEAAAGTGMQVVAVGSVDDAVRYLCGLGGRAPQCPPRAPSGRAD